MTALWVDPSFSGIVPGFAARNGLPASGPYTRALAAAVNHLAGRNGQIIPGKSVLPANARNTATELALWRTRYRAGANGTRLLVELHLLPTDDTAATNPYWYIKVDGAAAADVDGTTNHTHGPRCASGSGVTLSDITVVRAEFTVTAGTAHTVELWTKDKCRVVSWSLREKPRSELTIGTDTVADTTRLLTLSRIYDVDVASLVAAATSVQQKMGAYCLAFNVDDPATPIAASSTSATKVWDTAGTVSCYAPTQYRDTYASSFAATPAIPCYFWCYAARTAGANNVLLRLKGTNHAAGVDITINGAVGMYTSTAFTLAPQAGGDSLVAEYLVSNAGTTGDIYAFGLYPLTGT